MKWIGLTGGIATGKSTVTRLLKSLGYPVIDADQIAHQILEVNKEGYLKIHSLYGDRILLENLEINRKKLAEIIFNHLDQKIIVEEALHPLIQKQVQFLKSKYLSEGNNICFYDVPLLFEKKLQVQFDFVVTVWCDSELQIERLMNRNQISMEEARLRIQNQLPLSDKIFKSNFCIDNSGLEKNLFFSVKELVLILESMSLIMNVN